ncbi:hypothetical protein PENTCL1PPCAC_30224, partial [Pristionchus entomophagus]
QSRDAKAKRESQFALLHKKSPPNQTSFLVHSVYDDWTDLTGSPLGNCSSCGVQFSQRPGLIGILERDERRVQSVHLSIECIMRIWPNAHRDFIRLLKRSALKEARFTEWVKEKLGVNTMFMEVHFW